MTYDPSYWNEYDSGPKPLSAIGLIEAAAHLIAEDYERPCCSAVLQIQRVSFSIRRHVLDMLQYWYAPKGKTCGDFWWPHEDKESRLIALAFLIAIIETEGFTVP